MKNKLINYTNPNSRLLESFCEDWPDPAEEEDYFNGEDPDEIGRRGAKNLAAEFPDEYEYNEETGELIELKPAAKSVPKAAPGFSVPKHSTRGKAPRSCVDGIEHIREAFEAAKEATVGNTTIEFHEGDINLNQPSTVYFMAYPTDAGQDEEGFCYKAVSAQGIGACKVYVDSEADGDATFVPYGSRSVVYDSGKGAVKSIRVEGIEVDLEAHPWDADGYVDEAKTLSLAEVAQLLHCSEADVKAVENRVRDMSIEYIESDFATQLEEDPSLIPDDAMNEGILGAAQSVVGGVADGVKQLLCDAESEAEDEAEEEEEVTEIDIPVETTIAITNALFDLLSKLTTEDNEEEIQTAVAQLIDDNKDITPEQWDLMGCAIEVEEEEADEADSEEDAEEDEAEEE